MHYAHQRGILHRDLKPANILLDSTGEPFVADFGLAKQLEKGSSATQSGNVVGTPSYMAPEQADGKTGTVTTLADVYGLGGILYFVLTGRSPFQAETLFDTLRQVRETEPVSPSKYNPTVPEDLAAICLMCLCKDPQRRYASAAELAEDLERWLAGDPTIARPPSAAQQAWLWLRKNVRAAVWVAALGLALGLIIPLSLWIPSMRVLIPAGANAYAHFFPSLRVPLIFRIPLPSNWIWLMMVAVSLITFAALGPLTMRLVRPADRWADAATGASIGLLAGVISLPIIVGPAFVISFTILGSVQDLLLLSSVANTRPADGLSSDAGQPPEKLAEKYPDLAKVPEEKRGGAIFEKVLVDQISGAYASVFCSVLFVFAVFVPAGVCTTMAAGRFFRKGSHVFRYLLSYMELSLGGTGVFVGAVVYVISIRRWHFDYFSGGPVPELWSIAVLMVVAVLRGWRWPVRLLTYITWLLFLVNVEQRWRVLPVYWARVGLLTAGVFLASAVSFYWYSDMRSKRTLTRPTERLAIP